MSVREWTPAQRLLVELRKAIRTARKAGRPTDYVALSHELDAARELDLPREEDLLAVVRNREGRRFCFTGASVYFETAGRFEGVRYDDITGCHWITDETDLAAKALLKREHGDRLILRGAGEQRYELDQLGWPFQNLFNFFKWVTQRTDSETDEREAPRR
jgi:hypothetical protein